MQIKDNPALQDYSNRSMVFGPLLCCCCRHKGSSRHREREDDEGHHRRRDGDGRYSERHPRDDRSDQDTEEPAAVRPARERKSGFGDAPEGGEDLGVRNEGVGSEGTKTSTEPHAHCRLELGPG